MRSRNWLVRALLVIGAALAAIGLIAGHINRNVLDGPTFAAHVDDVRRDEAVATEVGQVIATQVIMARPDLVALLPLVEAVSVQVAGSDVLSGPVQRSAETFHTALTEENADSVVLRIVDAGAIVTAVLAAVAPDRVPAAADVSVTLVSIGDQSFADGVLAFTRVVGVLAWLLPVLALACFAGAVGASRERWRTAMSVGWALTWSAAAIGFVLVVGGFLTRRLDTDTLGGAVGQAAWNEFVRPMWWATVVLAVIGVAVVLTCGSALPEALRSQTGRAKDLAVRRPTTTLGIVGRAAVLGIVGIAMIADPIGMVELLALGVGVGLVLFALTEVAQFADRARTSDTPERSRKTALIVGGVVVLVALAGVVLLAQPARDIEAEGSVATGDACNGHAELCDRRFDEVAYASSHNSMSVATEPGWFIPEQLDSIPVQLDQGVRALLVDVWSGLPAGDVVRTAPGSYEEALAITQEELGPEVVAAAGRIAEAIAGVAEGPEARFMCHGLCETGSTPFVESLIGVRDWLAVHPDEVVTLFIEDHVDSDLIAADVEAAGLLPYVYEPVAGEPWPTLGEMIDSGRRLVVMVEEGEGGASAPWLVNGFESTQDTPYTFPTVESFTCDANRGPADAPLLLLNHWLSGFSSLVTNAQQVNAREVLLDRSTQCADERGQIPNFVAVNFVAIGDVYDVVDELNGVG